MELSSGCAQPGSTLLWREDPLPCLAGAVTGAPRPGLVGQEAHFLLLNVPRILGTNFPTLLSLVSSSARPSPPPGLLASSFLQMTSQWL